MIREFIVDALKITTAQFNEAIGIIAALLVCISLCLKNIKGLRIINLAGSAVFAVYGFLLGSFSVILLNSFAVLVNIYHLFRIRSESSGTGLFDVFFVDSTEDDTLKRFVRFHGDDICRFFPSFNGDLTTGTLVGAECCFILRETMPVSLVAFKRDKDDEITILVDYVIPAFRDMKNAKFFFSNVAGRIASPGSVFLAQSEIKSHIRYLKRVGFIELERAGKTVYLRKAA